MQPSTSLDPEETSISKSPESTYQTWRRRSCDPEWIATEEMYFQHYGTDDRSIHTRFIECRTDAYFVRHYETQELRIKSNACRARWCPICGSAKSSYLGRVVLEWCSQLKNIKLLTFTLRHSKAPLAHQIKHLYASFQKIRKDKKFSTMVNGGIWMFQVKQSKTDGLWHPHLHCIIDAEYIPQKWLSKTWSRITKTSKIVDIRSIRQAKFAAYYVSRYAVRPANLAELSPDRRLELMLALHGKRLCGTWGTGRAVILTEPPRTDAKDWETLGSWKDIIAKMNTDSIAAAIWKAYLADKIYTGKPFDESLAKQTVDPRRVTIWYLDGSYKHIIDKGDFL